MHLASKNRKKRRLAARYGSLCWKCQERAGTTLDHLVPQSFLGSNFDDNLRLACKECNGARRNRMDLFEMLEVARHPKAPRFFRPGTFKPLSTKKFLRQLRSQSDASLSYSACKRWKQDPLANFLPY
jgi:hypothetical protein